MQLIYVYDIIFFLIFGLFVAIFLYKRRKRVKVEAKIFLMYKTKRGLKFMDWASKKFSGLWNVLSYISITFGFLMMIVALAFFFVLIKIMVSLATVPKIPPLMPLVPYLPQIFNLPLPPFYFSYWIVIILIVAVTHEFAHGIFARYFKLKIKSTGFGFLGPFLAAFVEPDEKAMQRKSKKAQLSIISAGSFSNFIFGVLFLILMQLFLVASTAPAGIIYAATIINTNEIETMVLDNTPLENLESEETLELLKEKKNGDINQMITIQTKENETFYMNYLLLKDQHQKLNEKVNESKNITVFYDGPLIKANVKGEILKINNIVVKNYDKIFENLSQLKPNDTIVIETTVDKYEIIANQNPINNTKGFLGIGMAVTPTTGVLKFFQNLILLNRNPFMFYESKYNYDIFTFFYNLLWWLVVICFSVALINMLPLGILDGGRFIYLAALGITKSKKKAELVYKGAAFMVLAIFLLLMLIWLIKAF